MTLPRSDCKRGNGVNRKVEPDATSDCAWQGTPSLRSSSERSCLPAVLSRTVRYVIGW